jgi:hypothetical protein
VTDLALDLDVAAVAGNDAFDYSQPKPHILRRSRARPIDAGGYS